MANSYELLMSIGGKLDGSLLKSVSSASKAIGGMGKSAESSSKTMNLLKGAVGVVAGAFAVKKIVDFGESCIKAAGTGEQAVGQLQAVLKSTGGAAGETQAAAENLASGLSSVTTFSKSAVLSSEDLLLTFTKIGKNVMPQATETVLNMSQALGQDTKSSAVQLGKALNDPITGMTALSRVGVTFSAGQKKQITAMQKSGNLMGAQKIVLKELNTEFGNSARAMANTPEGHIKQLNNAWTQIKATIGDKLIPVVTSAITIMAQHIPQVKSAIMGVVNSLTPAFGYIKGTLVPSLGKAFTALGPLLKQLPGIIKSDVLPVFTTGFKVATEIIKVFINNIKPITGIAIGIASALVAFKVAQLGINAAEKAGMIIQALGKAWQTAGVFIKLLQEGEKLGAVAQLALNMAMDANPAGVVALAIMALVAVGILLYKNWGTISKFLIGVWNSIKAGAISVFGTIGSVIINGFNTAISFITSLPSKALGWGKDFIGGLVSGIKGAIGAVGDAVSGIANKIKSVLHFSTPDVGPLTDYETWMPDMLKGMGKGLKVNANLVMNPVKDIALGIRNKISDKSKNNSINISGSKSVKDGGASVEGSPSIVYAPQITIQGNASKDDVSQALDTSQKDFEKKMKIYERNKGRVKFA